MNIHQNSKVNNLITCTMIYRLQEYVKWLCDFPAEQKLFNEKLLNCGHTKQYALPIQQQRRRIQQLACHISETVSSALYSRVVGWIIIQVAFLKLIHIRHAQPSTSSLHGERYCSLIPVYQSVSFSLDSAISAIPLFLPARHKDSISALPDHC